MVPTPCKAVRGTSIDGCRFRMEQSARRSCLFTWLRAPGKSTVGRPEWTTRERAVRPAAGACNRYTKRARVSRQLGLLLLVLSRCARDRRSGVCIPPRAGACRPAFRARQGESAFIAHVAAARQEQGRGQSDNSSDPRAERRSAETRGDGSECRWARRSLVADSRVRRRADDLVTRRRERVPQAAEGVHALAVGVAGLLVAREEVERVAVVGDL